jgi:membrane-associated protease RseP (regulator of RpoE activity)
MPGYTKYSQEETRYSDKLQGKLVKLVTRLNQSYQLPVIMEPPHIKDLKPIIHGVVTDTPAAEVGLKKDDVIRKINGAKPFSRVEAFNQLYRLPQPKIEVKRGNRKIVLQLQKEKEESSGVVMDYDFSNKMWDKLQHIIEAEAELGANIGIVTSGFAYDMIRYISEHLLAEKYKDKYNFSVFKIENTFFGGTIKAVGLLTVDDIIRGLMEKMEEKINLFVIPGIIFDDFGKDLIGNTFKTIEQSLDIKTYKL